MTTASQPHCGSPMPQSVRVTDPANSGKRCAKKLTTVLARLEIDALTTASATFEAFRSARSTGAMMPFAMATGTGTVWPQPTRGAHLVWAPSQLKFEPPRPLASCRQQSRLSSVPGRVEARGPSDLHSDPARRSSSTATAIAANRPQGPRTGAAGTESRMALRARRSRPSSRARGR